MGVPWTTGVSREVPGPPLELHTGRPRACSRRGSLPQGDTAQGSPYQGTDAVGPGYQRARDVKFPTGQFRETNAVCAQRKGFRQLRARTLTGALRSSQSFCLRLEGPLDALTILASSV